jgi:hypothetical protein
LSDFLLNLASIFVFLTNYCLTDPEHSKSDTFSQATQLIVWRILNDSDAFPYLIKGVSYGNGRYEREKYERPKFENLPPFEPERKLNPFLENLVKLNKSKVKKM